jgi:hypothetical protein
MPLKDQHKKKIKSIWDKYVSSNKKVQDTKGNDMGDIDKDRVVISIPLNEYIDDFLNSKIDLGTFKTNVDSLNKQNNLWGFTSIKGQMFFNLLLKTCHTEKDEEALSKLIKTCIKAPKDLEDAKEKIGLLYKHCKELFDNAPDKRRVPNPGSITYFLSYFWQLQDSAEWPIMYSSMIVSFSEIGIWSGLPTPMEDYEEFYRLNEEIKQILSDHTTREISNWDAEHCFWNFRSVTAYPKKEVDKKGKQIVTVSQAENEETEIIYKSSFNILDYVIPAVAGLIELGIAPDKSASTKGADFEKAVSDVFDQLGFEVEYLGQGKGRNPDAVIRYKKEHTAFLVDAKAYTDGYSPGRDDRAFRDYIRDWCPKLLDEGIKKIGFIIVSNSFNTTLDTIINDLTWNTDIKRFILFETEALLHLIAFKNKHKLELSQIISQLVGLGNVIRTQDIIQQFDDV